MRRKNGKGKGLGSRPLLGHPGTTGQREDLNQTHLAGLLPVHRTLFMSYCHYLR